jgi:hypothetical protein
LSSESAISAVSPSTSKNVDKQGEKRVGVGLTIMQDSQGSFIVADVMPDSPALAAGLQAGDILESVDNRSVRELRQSNVVRLLRGPAGSMVKVDIAREVQVVDDCAPKLVRRTFVLTRLISGKNTNAQSQVPYSPSSPAASILPQKLNASFVEKKLSLHVAVLAVENLDHKAHGDQVECKVRILHPSRSPLVVGSVHGTWDEVAAKASFGDASFDFQVPDHELEDAQIESTLWEDDAGGIKVFVGEVIVNVERLDSLAKEQPHGKLSQDFQFPCKEGWTFPTVRSVTAKLSLRVQCSTSA